MNKLIIDKENIIEVKDNAIELEIKVTNLTLNIQGKVFITEIDTKDNEHLNLTINLKPNSSLTFNRFIIQKNMQSTITLNQQYNSTLNFNYSFTLLILYF